MQTILICKDSLNIDFLNSFFKRYFPEIATIASTRDVASTLSVIDASKIDLLFVDSAFMENEEYEITLQQLTQIGIHSIVLTNTKQNLHFAKKFPSLHFIYKPLTIEAFDKVLTKIKKHFSTKIPEKSNERAQEDHLKTEPTVTTRFVAISHEKSIELIRKDEILYLKSQGKYTYFHLKGRSEVISSRNIGEYEREINEANFIRIHQSYMVNLDYVLKIVKEAGWLCYIDGGDVLPVSRRKKEEIYMKLKLRV